MNYPRLNNELPYIEDYYPKEHWPSRSSSFHNDFSERLPVPSLL